MAFGAWFDSPNFAAHPLDHVSIFGQKLSVFDQNLVYCCTKGVLLVQGGISRGSSRVLLYWQRRRHQIEFAKHGFKTGSPVEETEEGGYL